MDEKTARKYRDCGEIAIRNWRSRRTWRTRKDPFEEVWPEVLARLEAEPKLRAFALFGWLQEKYPGAFFGLAATDVRTSGPGLAGEFADRTAKSSFPRSTLPAI